MRGAGEDVEGEGALVGLAGGLARRRREALSQERSGRHGAQHEGEGDVDGPPRAADDAGDDRADEVRDGLDRQHKTKHLGPVLLGSHVRGVRQTDCEDAEALSEGRAWEKPEERDPGMVVQQQHEGRDEVDELGEEEEGLAAMAVGHGAHEGVDDEGQDAAGEETRVR